MSEERLLALRGRRAALLVVDVQRSFADPDLLGHLDTGARARVAAAVARTADAVEAARGAGVDVVWVQLRAAPGDPWPASNWFRGVAESEPWPTEGEPCVEGTPGVEWYGVSPLPGEPVVVKRTYDGFHATTLRATLRELGTQWVAVTGLTSECCVLATAASAFNHGFPVAVVADATTAYDPGAHAAALLVLSLNSAVVADLSQVRGAWTGGTPQAGGAGKE